jgi:hypothetical protein
MLRGTISDNGFGRGRARSQHYQNAQGLGYQPAFCVLHRLIIAKDASSTEQNALKYCIEFYCLPGAPKRLGIIH